MAVNIGNLVAGESEIELSYISIPALKGDKGDTGRGISSVIKTSTVGLVDTWTITYTDGSTSSFDVTNGADGDDYVITSEDYQEIADIVLDNIEIPSKTSDLENDSGFIDNTVNDLQNYYKKSETYTKQEVDEKVSSVYKYKGSVATYQDLPSTSLTIGDVYNVESTGDNYAWTGTTWDKLGGEIDLSEYYTKTQVDSALENKVDKVTGKGLSTNDFTNADKTKLNSLENYDDTEVKSDIETLDESQASQDEIIAKLKADHPDIEEEGTDLSLQGTGDFELALSPKGNISQETREGYNLLNPNDLEIFNSNKYLATKNFSTQGKISVEANQKYSFIYKSGMLSDIGYYEFDENNNKTTKSATSNTSIGNYTVKVLQFSSTAEKFSFYSGGSTAYSSLNEMLLALELMFIKGDYSSATASTLPKYEPYGASPSPSYPSPVKVVDGEYTIVVANNDNTETQTKTIDTSPNPLYSEDDYYYKSNGNWYVHNKYGKYVFNGTETFNKNSVDTSNTLFYIANVINFDLTNGNNSKCNYLTQKTLVTLNVNNEEGFYCNTTSSNYVIYMNIKTELNTGASVKAKIKDLYDNNTPMYFIYPLANPTNTQITNTTLINQLETFQNMLAYKDQTNISQAHNEAQADMIINAKTIMSLKYMQSEIEELKQAILNS